MLLDELAKHDKKWRGMALTICKDTMLSDDLTQEMYIKMAKSKKAFSDINNSYMMGVIRSCFIDHIRKNKNKETPISLLDEITQSFFEIDNIESIELLEHREMINDALNELDESYVDILLYTHQYSLRETQDILGEDYNRINYLKNIGLKKLEKTEVIKKYKKTRNL